MYRKKYRGVALFNKFFTEFLIFTYLIMNTVGKKRYDMPMPYRF